jgi:hypothetical protein
MIRHRHIIHRQTLEMGMPSGKSPMAVQDRLHQVYYEKVIPRLEKLFSGLAGDDVIIRIDRLDLDLGPVEGDQLEEQFPEKVLRAMKEVLEEKLRFEVAEKEEVRALSVRHSMMEALFYFLHRGYLPWWSPIETISSLETEIMAGGSFAEAALQDLRQLVEQAGVGLDRLAFQFSPVFLEWVCEQFYPAGSQEEMGQGAGEEGASVDGETGGGRTTDMRARLIESARRLGRSGGGERRAESKRGGTNGEEQVVNAARNRPGEDASGPEQGGLRTDDGEDRGADELKGLGDHEKEQHGSGEEALAWRKEADGPGKEDRQLETDDNFSWEKIMPEASEAGEFTSGAERKAAEIKRGDDRERRKREPEKRKTSFDNQDDDAVFPELAGLVLLHPFLAPFFEELGLLEGKVFRDDTARHRAVHLLGFLATGEEEIEEPRLFFAKLLCGMPAEEPVHKNGGLSRKEMEEAEGMLTTVAGYWKGLKSQSIWTLREYFLRRQGKLSRKDEGWQLEMEKKTWDILFGSLPWGYSIVKLPWMRGMVFVNWG